MRHSKEAYWSVVFRKAALVGEIKNFVGLGTKSRIEKSWVEERGECPS